MQKVNVWAFNTLVLTHIAGLMHALKFLCCALLLCKDELA